MGSWGYRFTDGDDYFNDLGLHVDPLLTELSRELKLAQKGRYFDGSGGSTVPHHIAYHACCSFRTAFMTTFVMLSALPSLSLTDAQFQTLTDGLVFISKNVELAKGDWDAPSEFVKTVTGELRQVTEWLNRFTENSSLLADRMPALMAALG